jgi:colanic acid biosynthesis glycosyl transferase WcaI
VRLLLVNQHYPPDQGATGRLAAELASGLVRRGHEVRVLTGRPSYPEARSERAPARERMDGVDVVRVPTAARREGMLGRGTHYASFAAAALVRGLALPRPDVVLAWSSTPLFGGLLALSLARAKRCPLVWGVQDVHPEISRALSALPPPIDRGWARVDALTCRAADRVVVIADDLRPAARARGVAEERLVTIRNWADARRIAPREPGAFRREVGLRDRDFVVQYAGNLGRAQDLDTVLAAARLAHREDDRVQLLLVGSGSAAATLAARAASTPGARLVGFQPEERVAEVLAAADLSLVPLRAGLSRWCVPSKVYPILASGRPVGAVLDDGSEVARIVDEAGCGFRVDPGDIAGLAREILRLASDRACARRLGSAGRAWLLRHAALENALDAYEALLEGINSRSSGRVGPPTR